MHPLEQEEVGAEEVKYKPKETSNPMESSEEKSLVVFTPSGHRDYFENGLTLLEAARKLGVDLDRFANHSLKSNPCITGKSLS